MSKSDNQSIEEQMHELRQVVAWFEGDDFVLEEAGIKFEQAAKRAQAIEKQLGELKNTVTVVKEKFDT